jgi:hypothetical protein
VLAPVHMSKEKAGLLDNSVWHAVLAVKAVRAALRAVLRESATPSPDGCAATCLSTRRAIPPEQDGDQT